jgi:natural product biosynthesis luciferase-like monooxygenase protein
MKFGVFFFSGDERNKYRLVLEAAKLADESGLSSIWTPERHFHRFGGLYPNPSVLGAALAVATSRIQIRAGSIIFPSHHLVRVAEEWAVVDNLSGGRVGLALATGFSPIDFAFRPDRWADRRAITFEGVEQLRRIWQGEPVAVRDGVGNVSEVEVYPKPIQPDLPLWLTCTKSRDTFVRAGELGCNVLTAFVDMGYDELAEKLDLYRATLLESGRDPADHEVTLMMHTFLGDDLDEVKEISRGPFMSYLRSFFRVIDTQKKSFTSADTLDAAGRADQEALLRYGFDKFFGKLALLGTVESSAAVVERMRAIGVTEIACLIDFGIGDELVLSSLRRVVELARRFVSPPGARMV